MKHLSRSIFTLLALSTTSALASPILGSWFINDETGPVVITFLPSNEFVFIQDGDTNIDPNGEDGMERGTWSWNQTSGNLTTNTITDTNGEWGLSHPGPTPQIFMLPLAQSFAYQDDIEIEEVVLYKVRPISFSAWSSEQNLSGNNALPTAKPFPDGVENILRYAMNLSPDSSPDQRPSALIEPSDPQNLIFQYRRRIGLTGVNLTPQYSYDLVEWHDAPPASIQEIEPADPETATFRVTIPNSDGKTYGRLKAVATP